MEPIRGVPVGVAGGGVDWQDCIFWTRNLSARPRLAPAGRGGRSEGEVARGCRREPLRAVCWLLEGDSTCHVCQQHAPVGYVPCAAVCCRLPACRALGLPEGRRCRT